MILNVREIVPHIQLYLWIQNGADTMMSKKHKEQAQERNVCDWITHHSINFPIFWKYYSLNQVSLNKKLYFQNYINVTGKEAMSCFFLCRRDKNCGHESCNLTCFLWRSSSFLAFRATAFIFWTFSSDSLTDFFKETVIKDKHKIVQLYPQNTVYKISQIHEQKHEHSLQIFLSL